ncbi:MAG: glutathione binding-like protein [Pseudomonadota bacterium]
MAFRYVDFAELKAADGLRAIYVGGVPSPWGEAAKGVLHVKGLDHLASRLDYSDEAMRDWTPGLSAPVIVDGDEAPVDKARDIVALAERLAPTPVLLPEAQREDILAFIDDLANEGGLGWDRRVQLVHWSLQGKGGFNGQVAGYLAAKYGHSEDAGEAASAKVIERLSALTAKLKASKSGYYFGDALTAADLYAAAFMALFAPLPHDQCAMSPPAREAFSMLDEATGAAVDPILLSHRDRIYADHLELPLSL